MFVWQVTWVFSEGAGRKPRTVMKSGFKNFLIGVCVLVTAGVLVIGMITVFRWALPWASTDKATPAAVAVSEVDLVAKTAKEIQPKVEAIVKDIVAAAQEDAKEDRAELARKMQALADEIKAYGTETP
jgi:hypothetical protein